MNVIESIKGRSSLFYCCIHQLFPGCFISELGYKVRTYKSNGISHGSICSSNMERDLRGWQRFYWEIRFRRLMLQVSVLALEQLTALLTTRIFPMKRVITNVCSCNKASPQAQPRRQIRAHAHSPGRGLEKDRLNRNSSLGLILTAGDKHQAGL